MAWKNKLRLRRAVLVSTARPTECFTESKKFPEMSQPLSSLTFNTCNAKSDTTSSTYMGHIQFSGPPPTLSDGFLLLRKEHNFSLQAESESEKEPIKEADMSVSISESKSESESESENELDIVDTEEETTGDNVGEQRGSSGLFKVVVDSSSMSPNIVLDKWVIEGHDLSRSEISHAMFELQRRKMYGKALQLSEWLESQESIEFSERDYASRVDLVAKIRGLQKAEAYIDKIPDSFKGEIVYRTLLANCVLNNDIKKAERVFNKMKDLNLPVTAFACNQLLLLYKRTD
ncbi:hypothetical protein R6Q59_025617 [Mikania micrantha]